jgi:hypothetical protein
MAGPVDDSELICFGCLSDDRLQLCGDGTVFDVVCVVVVGLVGKGALDVVAHRLGPLDLNSSSLRLGWRRYGRRWLRTG